MDCLRSGLDWPAVPELPVVLAGRGGAAGSSPKKLSPRRESLVLVGFGGAGSALGGTLLGGGPAVFALGGGTGSPPMRSGGGAMD